MCRPGRAAETFADEFAVHQVGEFPRHEHAAPQQIGAGVSAGIFQNARDFGCANGTRSLTAETVRRNARRQRQQAPSGPNAPSAECRKRDSRRTTRRRRARRSRPSDLLARRLGDELGVDAVDGRLVHRSEDVRQVGAEILVRHDADRVIGAIVPRDHAGQRRFVLVPAAKFLEAQCDGVNIVVSRSRMRPSSAAESSRTTEKADRNIGDQMVAHAVEQRRADARLRAQWPCRRTLRLGKYLRIEK